METEEQAILNELPTTKKDTWTSRGGITFRFKAVPRLIVAEGGRKLKNPKIPMVMNEDKGRMEENPLDPDYVEAMKDVDYRRGLLAIDVYLTLGTVVVDKPADLLPVESEEWSSELETFGLDIPKGGRARYAAWLKFYALSDDDLSDLSLMAMRFGGATLEEDVKKEEAGFRSDGSGSADSRSNAS